MYAAFEIYDPGSKKRKKENSEYATQGEYHKLSQT